MARRRKASMTSQTANIAGRAGDFLERAFPGPHKSKRVAQRFEISPAMAKLLRAGEGWTAQRIGQAAHLFGRDFVAFVFQDVMGPARPYELDPQIAALNDRLMRLRAQARDGDDGIVAPAVDPARREPQGNVDAEGRAGADEGGEVGSAVVAVDKLARRASR